jgi:nucleoside-diphosphate-sugar epimerase
VRWGRAHVVTVSLVTGGNGFFGTLLVDRLVQRGHEVRVLDITTASDFYEGVSYMQGDIRDRTAVMTAVDGCDVIFHNVAMVPLSRDESELRSVNVDGTAVVLAAAQATGVDKIVHTSSSAIFGVPSSNPVGPTTVPKPEEPYGHAKLAAEWACLAAVAEGLDVTIVRPRTILGHGRLGIFGILFDWIADGANPLVFGQGSNTYQFVHAEDLADACIAAGSHEGPDVFNIGTDRFGTMFEALDGVCAHAGTGSSVRRLPARTAALAMRASARLGLTPFAPYHWLMYSKSMWFDIEHTCDALAWHPRWSNDAMFADSYDWFIGHRDQTTKSGGSLHRRSARQGALKGLKRVSGVLPAANGSS